MAPKQIDINSSLADYKEHIARKPSLGNTKPKEHRAQKRTKIDKAIANAQAFQKQRTALINMSTKDKVGAALEAGIIGAATGGGIIAAQKGIGAAQNAARTNPKVKAAIAKATSIPESISYAAKTNPKIKAANAKYSDLPGYISNEMRRNFEIEVNIRNHPYFIDSGGYRASAGVASSGREPGVTNNLRQLIADQKLRKKLRPYEEVLINDDMVLIQAAKVINKATEKQFKGITKRIK